MIEDVRKSVQIMLANDKSGHGIEHVDRVMNLALKFAKDENADECIVSLIALLHDVDDYKLFGKENADGLFNAKKIMKDCNVPEELQDKVCSQLKNFGYSKLLKGIYPTTIEGKVVADADMCECLGASGILRLCEFGDSNGKKFFDKNVYPVEDITAEEYISRYAETSVSHIFEKVLKLKNVMFTNSGKKEASKRHQVTVLFLEHLFMEEDAPDWTNYLKEYLSRLEK